MFYIWHTLLITAFIVIAYYLGFRYGKEKREEVLETAKDHCKEQIRDCKYEIAIESGMEVKELPPTDPLKQEKKLVDVEELYKDGM